MARLLNLGSLNIDHTYRVKRLAAAGETVPVFALERHIGGKGLNQSAAYARAGGKVFHGGKIGPDGLFLKQFLQDEGVDTGHVLETGSVTGHAVIQVDEEGRNGILVYGGANRELTENERRSLEESSENTSLLYGYAMSLVALRGTEEEISRCIVSEDEVSDQKHAEGFITLFGLPISARATLLKGKI